MACFCCQSLCTTCPQPPAAGFANVRSDVRLTVRLLSGSLLAKLVVEPSTIVADLKLRIEKSAQLPPGRVVRWLAWHSTELQDGVSMQELGLSRGELLAVCADALVGDFETYMPGCPTCDFNSEMQSVRFFADGTALIQLSPDDYGRSFHYRLGELAGDDRQLEFVEDKVEAPVVYTGFLHVSAMNPIHRRVKIPELHIDVEDVRYLKQKGETALQKKMDLFFAHFGNGACGYLHLDNFHHPSAIPYSEDEVWEARSIAWDRWEETRKEEDMLDFLESSGYDKIMFVRTVKPFKENKRKQKRVLGKNRQRGLLRWERPKLM